MSFVREEEGQGLLVVLALVGLISVIAYGYVALAASAGQQSTLRTAQLGEYRASDSGATYALWYGANRGFPPPGALTAPDAGDGLGAPTVTIADLRPALAFGPLHRPAHGPRTYDSPGHAVVGVGDVFFTFTWTSDRVGAGTLNLRFDTTAVQPAGFAAQATVTMPVGANTTTSAVVLPATVGAGTYYLHVQNVTPGPDTHLSSVGTFSMNYAGMRYQAVSVRNGRTTALDAGLWRNAGAYTAVVNSWTLR